MPLKKKANVTPKKKVAAKGKIIAKRNSAPVSKKKAKSINAWEQDPGSGNKPDGGLLIKVSAPVLSAGGLPTSIVHPAKAPSAKVYAKGTANFRYWAAAAALSRGSGFWSGQLPGTGWEPGKSLPIDLDFGEDLNAYYDREGLKFFHGVVGSRTFYSGESPDVINHEQGHAVLDSFKPQLWDAASIEVAAFHESFGDMSAMLCGLQVPSLRAGVITETNGSLYRNSRLSRLAEQLGWAIRQNYPNDVDPDCLRNAVNNFFYQDPDTLPTSAPAASLSSEPHSFSRIYTAAFLEGLAGMFKLQSTQTAQDLEKVSQDMAAILISGIHLASVVPEFFSQVAANMISAAAKQFPSMKYDQALKSAFIGHGILSAANAASIDSNTVPAFSPKSMATAGKPDPLPIVRLSVAEYGLGMDSIMVKAASEPKSVNVSGAAFSVGVVPSTSHEDAAKSFVEDLLRRGKLKVDSTRINAKTTMAIARVGAKPWHETHELRKEGGEFVLRRLRIDCHFHH